jgi:hypothetical protein
VVEDTLRPDLAERLAIEKAGVIMIDSHIHHHEKGRIFLATRLTGVRRDQISSRTTPPTRAHEG